MPQETNVDTFATVTWTVADVQSLAPSLSNEKAAEWLHDNQERISELLIQRGWEVIQDLLLIDGIPLEGQD